MTQASQKPSIGRVVHYWVLNPEECQETPNPAIITRVHGDGHEGRVDLQVFGDVPPTGNNGGRQDLRYNIPHGGDAPSAGTWSWPPRFG